MPRLLPRLLQALRDATIIPHESSASIPPIHRPKVKSKWRPTPPSPDFSARGRSRSILLEPNPIINKRFYGRHKRLPPVVRSGPGMKDAYAYQLDKPRRMTVQERLWHSDPYLRMLSSPVRSCMFSRRRMPTDFMVRVSVMKVLGSRASRTSICLFPDGLEHPRWATRRMGVGWYIMCRKEVVLAMVNKGIWEGKSIPSSLASQIDHLLRIRVLQELDWLADQARIRPRNAETAPVLRRLTREEWQEFKRTGVIPHKSAVAVIVVAPVNKNPVTKERPAPHESPMPPPERNNSSEGSPSPERTFPLVTLHPTSAEEPEDGSGSGFRVTLPNPRIPVYNGAPLFPNAFMRRALHQKLNNLLFVERRARYNERRKAIRRKNFQKDNQNSDVAPSATTETDEHKGDPENTETTHSKERTKMSHAYLLYSNSDTLLRGDTVPLAKALWRLRLWEGLGWSESAWVLKEPPVYRP
ncbi:hypothetical protein K474DRAFT_535434 [Panus rudis PR-1116 ss-1]|nr:hypothetical protein K474DRAFT_535434 [Panus rudis PR-1116 ss-1]